MSKDEIFGDLRRHLPFLAKREGMRRVIETILGLPETREVFTEAATCENPFAAVIERLKIEVDAVGVDALVPADGPLVVIANHPYGGADALVLCEMLARLRNDALIMANAELQFLPGLDRWLRSVSILGEEGAEERNAKVLRELVKHVRRGGCMGVFPAGAVSYWRKGRFQEPEWLDHIVRMVVMSKASVLPLWFFGGNPWWYQLPAPFHKMCRTSLITRGLLAMKGRSITVRAGDLISAEALSACGDEASDFLQKKMQLIRDRGN